MNDQCMILRRIVKRRKKKQSKRKEVTKIKEKYISIGKYVQKRTGKLTVDSWKN